MCFSLAALQKCADTTQTQKLLTGAPFLSRSSHFRKTRTLADCFFTADRNSSPGERLVIIGKSFEGCQYADGEDAGLLNMACKTHPARQQSAHSPPHPPSLMTLLINYGEPGGWKMSRDILFLHFQRSNWCDSGIPLALKVNGGILWSVGIRLCDYKEIKSDGLDAAWCESMFLVCVLFASH